MFAGIINSLFRHSTKRAGRSIKEYMDARKGVCENKSLFRVYLSSFLNREPDEFPEFEMPTVTWGAVKEAEEAKASRNSILDYLKNIGIRPAELEDLELPASVETMKERVEFLQEIGLSIDDINEYPRMLGCSVRKNLIPVLGFMENVGLEKKDFAPLIRKFPYVLFASVAVELVPIIKFLRGLDIERNDIPYMLRRYPDLLGFKLEGTMSTSVAYLVNLGVNTRDIAPILTQCPWILGKRVGTMIKPIVDFLINLGIPKLIVARLVEKRPHIVGYDLEGRMKPNMETLVSYGVKRENLPSVVAHYPEILGITVKNKLSIQSSYLKSEINVNAVDFGRIIEKMPQVISLPQPLLLKRLDFLRGRGFQNEEISKMVVQCPQLFAVDIEDMKLSFYFFKSQIKRPLHELVDFPEFFTYSLEDRIKPRFEMLSRKGISCHVRGFLNCSDRRFQEILNTDGIDIPDASPCFTMGGALELPETERISEGEFQDGKQLIYKTTLTIKKRTREKLNQREVTFKP